jgi:hypothetical protein
MSNEQPLVYEPGARRWYGRLVNLYPGTFRERYAAEMLRVFEESWRRISDRGASARRRFWFHVIRDLIRTLPGEWLAAIPLPTKVSLLAIGIAVSISVINHQWLTIALWLFFCAFGIVCNALIYSSRLRILSSLLLAGALGWAGFWITTLLAKSIHGSHDHGPNGADHLSVLVAMLVIFFCKEILMARSPPGWDTTQHIRPPPRANFTSQFVLSSLCCVGILLAQLKINSSDSAIAGSQTVLAGFLLMSCVNIAGQFSVIWRSQNHARKPDSETRPA